ncbi:hypothetical protein FQR65_LT06122 [Abscondita terminalis]|nr:hypothetical protein FQR65_LT06122 [Abscondita terminalis]
MLPNFKLHYLPGITCGCFIITFITTYPISVLKGHVYPIFPFISETGTTPPESCIFSQMLNIGAVLMAVTNYIRYRQIDFAIKSRNVELQSRWNTFGLYVGYVVAFGISVVGNFQQTNVFAVHMLGALMSFGLVAIYFIIQTRISFAFKSLYKKYPQYGIENWVINFRLILTTFYVLLFVLIFTCGPLGMSKFNGKNINWWTEEDDGYGFHLIATFSEWGLFLVMVAYVFTGTFEFKSVEFKGIELRSKIFDEM